MVVRYNRTLFDPTAFSTTHSWAVELTLRICAVLLKITLAHTALYVLSFWAMSVPREDQDRENGSDCVSAAIDFRVHKEYWRFYQSGNFIHHFNCREDYDLSNEGKVLSIISTLWTFTEIFEFAARLAMKKVLDPSCEVAVRLSNMSERELVFLDPGRYLSGRYRSTIDDIVFSRRYDTEQITSQASSLALKATTYVFERFNWLEAPFNILAEDQKRLLERRF